MNNIQPEPVIVDAFCMAVHFQAEHLLISCGTLLLAVKSGCFCAADGPTIGTDGDGQH